MRKLEIIVALVMLCALTGLIFYSASVQKKQEKSQGGRDSTQVNSDHDKLQDVLDGDKDISDVLANVDSRDEFRTVREDWLKSVSGDADIDDALRYVKKIDFKKITSKDVEKAIQCGDLETLKKMRRSGFRKWDNRKFVLRAANAPFADIMKFLAENGADLDVADDEGHSVIYLAANGGNVETAKFLAGWIGDLRDVSVSRFPYLKDIVKSLSLAGVRNMMDIAITRKKAAGEDLLSKKTRRALFLELSKSITMERKSPQPEGYVEFQRIALVEAEEILDFKRKQSKINAAAEARYPLYKLLDRVTVGRQAGRDGVIYISGRLEKIAPRYIVVSQQTIHTMDIPDHEQSKFIPEVNRRYRREYVSSIMKEYEKEVKFYLRKRWGRHLRTARMNGYYYDKDEMNFVHASDVFEEELQKALEKKENGKNFDGVEYYEL